MKFILVSAMLQSRQVWLPEFRTPIKFQDFLQSANSYDRKFIAHCTEDSKEPLRDLLYNAGASKIILIGPEGDFTAREIEEAIGQGYLAVTLGENRLRTETAALVAAVLLKIV